MASLAYKGATMINLRYLREHANLSQGKLGEMVDVSQQTIYKYESGEIHASQTVLLKLSKVFNVPIEVFADDNLNIEDYIIEGGNKLLAEEKTLLETYRKLDKNAKSRLNDLIYGLNVRD